MITNSKILVTGAAGFIGFHTASQLADPSRDNLVYLVDNFARGVLDQDFQELAGRPNVQLISGDILDLKSELPSVDVIFHFAAINGTRNFYERPLTVLQAAILPTLALIDRYSQDNPVFVLASTSEVYAGPVELNVAPVPTPEDCPVGINDVTNPRWSYAAGKIASEMAAISAGVEHGFSGMRIVRFHNVYGPRMGMNHVIPEFLKRATEGRFELFGGSNKRSFIYIADAVEALEIVAGLSSGAGLNSPIFHIGTSETVSMLALGELILKINGFHGDIRVFPAPVGSAELRTPDVSKLNSLGFQPKVDLETGLTKTSDWYLKHFSCNES